MSVRQERLITFRYLEAGTKLHQSHPISKMAWFVVAMLTVLLSTDPLLMIAQIFLVLWLVQWLGDISLRQLKPLLIICVFVFAMTFYGMFTAPSVDYMGGQYRVFEGVQLSLRGALDGFVSGARFFVPAIIGLTIAFTTRQGDMTRALSTFVPYRLAYTASVGLAFLPLVQDLYDNSQKALAVRGLGFHGSWRSKLQAYIRLLFILLVGMLRQSDTMAMSLSNRAFGAYSDRTYYREYNFPSQAGWYLTGLWVILMFLTIALWAARIEPTKFLLAHYDI